MAYIDELAIKAANAGSAPVGLTGNELSVIIAQMRTILSSAGVASFNTRTGAVSLTGADVTGAGGALLASPTFTGVPAAPTAALATNTTQLATTAFVAQEIAAIPSSGLAVTGLDNGATVQDQIFNNGVTVGVASTTNGVLNFKNSAGATQVIVNSTAAKELKIDNTGHDVEMKLFGSLAISDLILDSGGIAANHAGGLGFVNNSAAGTVYVGGQTNAKAYFDEAAGTVLITGTNGVSTSNGLTVGGDILGNKLTNQVGNASLDLSVGHVATLGVDSATTKIDIDGNSQVVTLTAASGVNTSAGLTVGGGLYDTSTTSKDANYTIATNDFNIVIDASVGAVEIDVSGLSAGQICVIRAGSIAGGAATVSGLDAGTYTFATAKDCIIIYNDTFGKYIIAEYKQ